MHATCSAFGWSAPTGDGLCGGLPAKTGFYRLKRGTDIRALFAAGRLPAALDDLAGEDEWLPPKGLLSVGPDDVYTVGWFGGGGFGDPLERDPQAVERDVRAGAVSAGRALSAYGVVLDETGAVDAAATAARRDALRGERLGVPAVPPPPASPDLEDRWRRLDENLGIDPEGAVRCLRCATTLGAATANYKDGCRMVQRPVAETALAWTDPALFVDVVPVSREFACPGCGLLLEHETALAGDPVVLDKHLAAPEPAR